MRCDRDKFAKTLSSSCVNTNYTNSHQPKSTPRRVYPFQEHVAMNFQAFNERTLFCVLCSINPKLQLKRNDKGTNELRHSSFAIVRSYSRLFTGNLWSHFYSASHSGSLGSLDFGVVVVVSLELNSK